jgi:hypothetical protein
MGLTRVSLINQDWRRADGNHATVRIYLGPRASYTTVPAVFVNGEALVDDDLRDQLLRLGYVRLTP